MDLVAGVRKEGSRGGRADFKWEDVKDDAQRENYLGHSLMAPVGRWQKGRDLNWYAKGDQSPAAQTAAEARKEEIRRIKEAEQDALSAALGYEPVPRGNANETPLGKKEVEKAIRETAEGDEPGSAKGIGYGAFDGSKKGRGEEETEMLEGVGLEQRSLAKTRPKDGGRRPEKRRRSRSRERDRARRHGRSRSRDRSTGGHGRGREDEDRRHHRRRRSRDGRPVNDYRERSRSRERRRDGRQRHNDSRKRSLSPECRSRGKEYRDWYDDRR